MNSLNSTMMSASVKVLVIAAALWLYGCASSTTENVETQVQPGQARLSVEEQLAQLQAQMQTMQSDWEKQKTALDRLVTNEEDLQFLIKTLSDMSQIDDAPSRAAYLGKTEMTADQREALYSITHLINNQQQLMDMLQSLTDILKNHAGTLSSARSSSMTSAQTVALPEAPQDSALEVNRANYEISASSEFSSSSSAVTSTSTTYCECDPATRQDSSVGESTSNRSIEWFGLTQPYKEAAPAMGIVQNSQLDSSEVNNGQPIPGLDVKQPSRNTLPSELAAAGTDLQVYNAAPFFQQSRKSLSDYVAQLAFKLAGNQQLDGAKVGVASFVFFDSQLEQTSAVGNQLAEELSTVLPSYGVSVIEYKLTKNITVGPTGDLSLSRSTSKLSNPQGIDYVLIGTMVPTRRGLQINSRVVSTRNNSVISSAATLIPSLVLHQL